MTTPAYQRERGRLAEALKAVRVGAGLSGARLAEMLGWQQSKVSEIETRKQLPSEDDSAPVSTVQQCLVSTTATFAALTESWWRSPQPAQSRHHGLPVRAITVTRCDGRDNTDVRYPPGRGG